MGKVVEHSRNYVFLFCYGLIIQQSLHFFKSHLAIHTKLAYTRVAPYGLFRKDFFFMEQSALNIENQISSCHLCPRQCGVDRNSRSGYCASPAGIFAARAALHHWEEPCISGFSGSGTVFFSGCTLRCVFCQNYEISQEHFGKSLSTEQLASVFLNLQEQGAHNINLVTATQYLPWILPALRLAKPKLKIPIVYNCGGYERPETVLALKPYVDIWLPDFKYFHSDLAQRFSSAPDYFEQASASISQMIAQTGTPSFHTEISPHGQETLIMDQGVIIRHLVLPGHRDDSIALLEWIADHFPKEQFFISLMSQYTPYRHLDDCPELNRRITSYEYEKVVDKALSLGLDHGFMQKKSSAREEYTPPFDLEGLREI